MKFVGASRIAVLKSMKAKGGESSGRTAALKKAHKVYKTPNTLRPD